MRRILIVTICFLLCSVSIGQAWHKIRPGSHVYDRFRHVKQQLLKAEAIKDAINSADGLINQLRNLVSLPGDILQTTRFEINKSLDGILEPMQAIKGLSADIKKTENSWESSFKSLGEIKKMSPDDQVAHRRNMTGTLDKTYKDSFNFQGLVAQITNDQEQLDKLLKANSDADGAKDIGQTKNQLTAMWLQQSLREEAILASMVRTSIASKAAELQNEAMAENTMEQQVYVIVKDPYKPDDKKFTRPTGQGFIHF